jgi:3-oxoisoapionate decarboxylase
MRRRTFIQTTAGASLGMQAPMAAAVQKRPSGLPLGFDTYSVRAYEWKAIELLDFAAETKLCDTIQISDLADFGDLDAVSLRRVRDHAARLGISIDGGLGCICPTARGWDPKLGDPTEYIRKGLRTAQAVGATCMRCYMGGGSERRGPIPVEQHIENTAKVLRPVRSEALERNVKIAIENHNDLQARELRTLIEEAGKDFVGACFDTGNPISVVEHPMSALEILAPHVVTTHIKDFVIFEHPRGAVTQGVALGDGSMDYAPFFERFRELCPGVTVQLEVITGGPPRIMPFLEDEFWTPLAKTPAEDFARFLELVKSGHPFMGNMIIARGDNQPPEYQAALKAQQRIDLVRSLEYARNVLHLGLAKRG